MFQNADGIFYTFIADSTLRNCVLPCLLIGCIATSWTSLTNRKLNIIVDLIILAELVTLIVIT